MKRLTLLLGMLALAPLTRATAQQLATQRIAVGFQNPGMMAQAPGDDDRYFVFERRRGISIFKESTGQINNTLFLDLGSELSTNEAGTCFAFHPDYETNGLFYVLYMDLNQVTHLAQYTVSANPDLADAGSRVQILGPTPQPGNIHNWNCVKFGPDGMMYVSLGDGVLTTNTTDNFSQDLSNNFGTILRLDVSLPAPYVPADNPFVGQPGVDEAIWVYGLRQPWRFAFDPMLGDLYIGDVGYTSWEEIDILNAGNIAGKNMGWRCLEGDVCMNFAGSGCLACGSASYEPPVFSYPHDGGPTPPQRCAIIGGEVYRGSTIPSLFGHYIYADFCSGRFWTFKWDGSQITDHVERTDQLLPDVGGPVDHPTTFAVDHDGEIYILSNTQGEMYKIVQVNCEVNNYCTSTLNSAGTAATISNTGSTSFAANDFTLTVDSALPNKIGLFFYGPNQIQVPFGDGFRCVGGSIFRLTPASLADGTGSNQRVIDNGNMPVGGGVQPGTVWNFQYWYRDPAGPGLFNLSDAIEANFCP